ncbi:MAG: hypothetical protein GX596_01185 [Propionibacterium sp.]|nr:hypothetical protein [Propionibacterium sp.]
MLDVLRTLGAALGLDSALFSNLGAVPLMSVAGVAVLAAASTMLGHVAILALNRISGFRLVSSLLLSAAALTVLHATEAAVTWGVATMVLRRPLPLMELIIVALLALAPQVLNFLTALPHLGLGIGRLLQAWSYLILWFGVGSAFGLHWLWALVFTIAGWLAMQLLSRLAHRPISWLLSRLWRLATGRPTMMTSRDILVGMPIIPVDGAPKAPKQVAS